MSNDKKNTIETMLDSKLNLTAHQRDVIKLARKRFLGSIHPELVVRHTESGRAVPVGTRTMHALADKGLLKLRTSTHQNGGWHSEKIVQLDGRLIDAGLWGDI